MTRPLPPSIIANFRRRSGGVSVAERNRRALVTSSVPEAAELLGYSHPFAPGLARHVADIAGVSQKFVCLFDRPAVSDH